MEISRPYYCPSINRWKIDIDDKPKMYSHYVWFLNTGYWPDWENKREVVHHKNGDVSDDRFENLELKSNRLHASNHLTGMKHGKRSLETKTRMSVSQIGVKNPMWKGDTASDKSKRSRIKRKLEREIRGW